MFEIVYDGRTDGRRTDGRRLDGYTISSPCEPNGSGELKIGFQFHNEVQIKVTVYSKKLMSMMYIFI